MPRWPPEAHRAVDAAFDELLAIYRAGGDMKRELASRGLKMSVFYTALNRRGLARNGRYRRRRENPPTSFAEYLRELEAVYCTSVGSTDVEPPRRDGAPESRRGQLAQRVPVSLDGPFIEPPSLDRLRARR
jgi:hypothetical protein